MKFTKMHGCGNDYIFVDCFLETVTEPAQLAKQLSNRHFGIGGDGLVLIKPSQIADCTMRMYNADGSEGEMCGNAIRCVAKYVYDHDMIKKPNITIETLAGVKTLDLKIQADEVIEVTVNMGAPILTPKDIPMISNQKVVVDETINAANHIYQMTCVSMGNPHAVIFVEDPAVVELERIGSNIEYHEKFPNRTNVEFVSIQSRHQITVRVWERGSGETLACGTGACASVVAGVLKDQLDEEVTVKLKGGELKVRFDKAENQVYLTGPAKEVYNGDFMFT